MSAGQAKSLRCTVELGYWSDKLKIQLLASPGAGKINCVLSLPPSSVRGWNHFSPLTKFWPNSGSRSALLGDAFFDYSAREKWWRKLAS